jgi:quercetin dioxygenase-like cupin family protein
MTTAPTAPEFAAHFSMLIQATGKTQRQIARETQVPASSVNRLCKNGVGSEENICTVLDHLHLKRRRKLEMLADRRAELLEGPAKAAWEKFRYAFLDENEYLRELCPFPVERAYACAYLGIKLSEVVDLATKHGMPNIRDLQSVDPWKSAALRAAFQKRFGKKATEDVLARKCRPYPPVLILDSEKQVDPAGYVNLIRCNGRLIFGLPHLVIADYTFEEHGSIEAHRNTGGVEFLYSLNGTFELAYAGQVYPTTLAPRELVLVFDANKKHAVKLSEGNGGRLLMIRYYPNKREVVPGRPRRRGKR